MNQKELYRIVCKEDSALIPVFAQDWWLDAVCDAEEDWQVELVLKGEQLIGAWPFLSLEKFNISFLRNPRLTPYLGPIVFFPPDVKESNRDSFEYEVAEQLFAALPTADVWRLSVWPGFRQVGLIKRGGVNLGVQQTFLLDLSLAEQSIFQNFKESLRRNIKASEGKILIAAEPDAVSALFRFQENTLMNKGVAQSYTVQQLERLIGTCISHNAGTLWVAREGEKIQAVVFNVWDENRSYYLMGGMNPDGDNNRAMSALLWHCIREAKNRGNKHFDFEGSMDSGVERFFRSFGGSRALYLVLKRDGHWLWKLLKVLRIKK